MPTAAWCTLIPIAEEAGGEEEPPGVQTGGPIRSFLESGTESPDSAGKSLFLPHGISHC